MADAEEAGPSDQLVAAVPTQAVGIVSNRVGIEPQLQVGSPITPRPSRSIQCSRLSSPGLCLCLCTSS
jgi:hypothetical protein